MFPGAHRVWKRRLNVHYLVLSKTFLHLRHQLFVAYAVQCSYFLLDSYLAQSQIFNSKEKTLFSPTE